MPVRFRWQVLRIVVALPFQFSKALLYFLGCVAMCTLGSELRICVGLPIEMYILPELASIYASILYNCGTLIITKKLTLIKYY